MTTKTRTRKAPAAKIPSPEGFPSLPCDSTTGIRKLIARMRFLEADCRYHAAICDQSPNVKHVAARPHANEIIRKSRERGGIHGITVKAAHNPAKYNRAI
jgi:hypothetical protein